MSDSFAAKGFAKYWKPLTTKLKVGDRVWVYQRQAGYLGTGLVNQTAVPIDQFVLADGSKLVDRLDRADINKGLDPDKCAYAVGIKWDATVSLVDAKSFPGAFANQNIVCKLTDETTIAFLAKEFPQS